MSAGLDTSVTVRLLIGEPPDQAAAAWRLVAAEAASGASVALSDLVVSEAYFALRHHYATPHAEAIRALSALLSDPRIHGTGVARHVVAVAARTRPGFMDRLIDADYSANGAALVTFDRDAGESPGATLLR